MGVGLTVVIVAGMIMSASIAISALDSRKKRDTGDTADLKKRVEALEKHIAQQDETINQLQEDSDFVRRVIEDKTDA